MVFSLSLLDYGILVYVSYHAFKGLKKGFLIILIETITIILTFFFIMNYYLQIAEEIQKLIRISEFYSIILSLILIVLIMYGISWVVTKLLSFIITVSGLGILNRISGAAISCVKAIVIIIPLLLPLLWIQPQFIQKSVFFYKLRQLIPIETQLNKVVENKKISIK